MNKLICKSYTHWRNLRLLLWSIILLWILPSAVHAQADVIKASGGTNLSIDSVATQGFTPIDGPTIRETLSGQLAQNGIIVLTLPSGYVWNDALIADDITVTVEPTGAANTQLAVSFSGITQNEATFTVDTESRTRGNGQGPGRVEIQGLELRPNSTDVPATGEISNTGSTGPDKNYGNLSTTAGTISQVRVETEADGTGQIVPSQDILAGNSLTVYAIARDAGDNFIENIALDTEGDWSLINITGDVQPSAVNPSTNLRSATFSSQQTGAAQIQASYPDVSQTPSETITVLPRDAQEMIINTQPSGPATAGQPLPTQPVIFLLDQFGNKVTTDNSTQVTTSISSGSGSLSGTPTQTAFSGEIIFGDLLATVADTITLQFENPEFSTVTSNEVVVNSASASDLTYTQQPSNTAKNGTISPPVEVQLLDEFGNIVQSSGTQVTINDESFFKSSSTLSAATDSNGIATFDNLNILDNAPEGSVLLTSQFSGISSPVTSESFLIIAADELARFDITNTNGNDVGEQQAGSSFDVTITAKNGSDGDFVFSSDRTVEITSDGDIQKNGSSTSSFQVTIPNGGASVITSLSITSSGNTQIFADEEDVSGSSNTFNVTPSNTIDETQSTVTADPANITADGNSTSTITVQLKDEFGNNLVSGGETVELTSTAGTFSGGVTTMTANDEGDGTYTVVLTSSTTAGKTATISATVNDNAITDEATVIFDAGDVTAFTIDLPQNNGAPATQTAGVPFEIDITAVDKLGNTVPTFDGPVTFTTNSTISSGATATFSNGTLENYSITLTETTPNATITVSADDLFEISGTSAPFEINANQPDPAASQISASPVVLQNDGNSESVITIVLRDEYQNRIFQQQAVSLNATQLEEDNAPSPDGNASATFTNGLTSISNISFNNTQGLYRDTLFSTQQVELVEVTGAFGTSPSTNINQTPNVEIVIPNTWTAGAGGPAGSRTDWTNPDNWSQGEVPSTNDFVIIPDIDELPILDLNIEMGSFVIQSGASLTLFGGNAITVSGNFSVEGNLDIEDNTDLSIGGNFTGSGSFTAGETTTIEIGGNIGLNSFLARTDGSQINLNGDSPQTISTVNFLAQKLNISNDVTAISGNLIDTSELLITEGNTFEVARDAGITVFNFRNLSGDGQFILNNNTLVVTGDLSLLDIDTSEGTVILGIPLDEDFADYPDLEQQQIANLTEMQNAVINNTEGVRTSEDVIVEGDLTLENGELIIASGKSLIAPNQTYNNGSLNIQRRISRQGWYMLGAPINSDFADLFDGLTVQGMTNSAYPDRQPNLLYYNETIEGTDNQRWRTPDDLNNLIQDSDSTGRGFFFYVFGDVENDTDYNDSLPLTLNISGEEYQHQSDTFTFSSVTYTAEADTGFNLVSNPWASTIDWDNDNWTKTNIDNVIYIWDPSSNDYLTWNGIDGSLDSGLIKPFQAFWIKANGEDPVLTADKSAKTTGGEFYSKSEKKPASIEFLLEADTLSKETHITLTPDGSNGKDRKDAYRLLPFETGTYLEIFTTRDDGTQLSINNLARSFGKELTIPLHVGGYKDNQPLNGEYTLSWPQFGDVPEEWILTLIDQKTEKKIDLRKNSFYSFSLSRAKAKTVAKNTMQNFLLTQNPPLKAKNKSGSSENRFLLRIDPGADASGIPDEYALDLNYPNPFSNKTTIQYNTPEEGEVELMIYDILGRKVKTLVDERRPPDFHKIEWTPSQLASGLYICVMRAGGKQFTKKLTYIK